MGMHQVKLSHAGIGALVLGNYGLSGFRNIAGIASCSRHAQVKNEIQVACYQGRFQDLAAANPSLFSMQNW